MKNLKPFDLQAALSGKAVMLRDGSKAYVRHHETELGTRKSSKLLGYLADGDRLSWCENGAYFDTGSDSDGDIVGMYPETRIINGFEVPAPVTQAPEEGATYHFPVLHAVDHCGTDEWYGDEGRHKRYLGRGLVFLNAEDAIATAKAMLGIDPYEGDE